MKQPCCYFALLPITLVLVTVICAEDNDIFKCYGPRILKIKGLIYEPVYHFQINIIVINKRLTVTNIFKMCVIQAGWRRKVGGKLGTLVRGNVYWLVVGTMYDKPNHEQLCNCVHHSGSVKIYY